MNREIILLIETATESCSVALTCNNDIIAERYIKQPKAHATLLAPYILELLEENGLSVKDCTAIAVSSGPGSYTGLRVGVSCAKGLCYGANKPLIAINTLAAIAQLAKDNNPLINPAFIVPMIDAGRMEVYTATYNSNGEELTTTEAKILDENSFSEELSRGTVLFTGNGALKFKPLVSHPNAIFYEQLPHAIGMRILATKKLKEHKFEDNAYFEPFYLKDFIPGKPKKLL